MFHLYHHHDLGRLSALLGALIQKECPGPMSPETILVPNQGMQRWLQKELAENRGIVANVNFPLPAGFIWGEIIRDQLGYRGHEAWARDRMVWHLYRLLPDMTDNNPALARYLAAEPGEVHRLQLAERLADVFDQYQVFRGDMIEAWDRGEEDRDSATATWQAPVWRGLVEALGPDHRVKTLRAAITGLHEKTQTVSLPTGRVFVFGVGDLPPDYLRFLYALGHRTEGRQVDIHMLLPNPSEAYWGDIRDNRVSLHFPLEEEELPSQNRVESGHPLLASLGRPSRDFLHLLYSDELIAIQEPDLGRAMAYEPPQGDKLLHRLQRGIIKMDASPDDRGLIDDDVSLQVHHCHGPLREVQVLHDQLLDRLSKDNTLQPRDIVVMLPRLADYAPAIRSVFGGAEGERFIPWSVSDQARRAGHPIVQTFLDLLDLPIARWSASHIMSLVAVPAVMRRFGLDESDLDSLHHWVAESGIRWGLDADTRKQRGAGHYDENSWRFGLDRLLLGSVLADEEQLVDDVAPWSDLEGGAADTLGRLHQIIETLARWQDACTESASARQWHDRFNQLVKTLFQVDRENATERAALESIHEALGFLETAKTCLDETPISWLAVREAVGNALEESGERQPFLSGGVTFCNLQSLAGVPFRMVCLLGMNDGDFPRQDGGREFNLILHRRYLGDRPNRDADRLAFLQAILAAGDVFYLSYTGTDMRSGEAMEPAATVGEFLDFLHRHHFHGHDREAFMEALITRQPMQPFSRRYFEADGNGQSNGNGNGRIFTFRGEWRDGSRARPDPDRADTGLLDGSELAPTDEEPVELDTLRQFFRAPARHFLRDQLGIRLDEAEEQLEDDEAFNLNPLSSARLRQQLFDTLQSDDEALDAERPPRIWQRRGLLPPPPLDTPAWREEAGAVNELLPVTRAWRGEEHSVSIDLNIQSAHGESGPIRLLGRIHGVRADGLYRIRPGRLKLDHLLPHWIDYLVLKAAAELDDKAGLYVAGLDGDATDIRRGQLDRDTARRLLETLVHWYRQGMRRPLCFHPDLAADYLEARDKALAKHDDEKAAGRQVLDTLNHKLDRNDDHGHYLTRSDPYLMAVLDPDTRLGDEPGESLFCHLVSALCEPLHDTLERIELEQEAGHD